MASAVIKRMDSAGIARLTLTDLHHTPFSVCVLWYYYGHPDPTHTILCLWSYDTIMDILIQHTPFSVCGLMILLWTSWSNTHHSLSVVLSYYYGHPDPTHDSLSVVFWYYYGHPDPTHTILCLWSYHTIVDILIQHTRFSVSSLMILLWTPWSNTHHSLSVVLRYYCGHPDPTHTILCLWSYIMNILIQHTRFSVSSLMILLWTPWSNTHDSLSAVLWYCCGHPGPTHTILCLQSYIIDIQIQHTRFSVCGLTLLWRSWSNTHDPLPSYDGHLDPAHMVFVCSLIILGTSWSNTRFSDCLLIKYYGHLDSTHMIFCLPSYK